jgi:hypothetical protein
MAPSRPFGLVGGVGSQGYHTLFWRDRAPGLRLKQADTMKGDMRYVPRYSWGGI